jgi:hypothetical protein
LIPRRRLNWLVAVAIAVAILFLQGRWLTPNVYTVPLGRCDVDWHADCGIVLWPAPVAT